MHSINEGVHASEEWEAERDSFERSINRGQRRRAGTRPLGPWAPVVATCAREGREGGHEDGDLPSTVPQVEHEVSKKAHMRVLHIH